MTGRAAGYCAGNSAAGYTDQIPGRGRGRGYGWGRGQGGFGRGAGRGWRNGYNATGMPGWQRAAMGYPAFGGWQGAAMQEPTAQEEMGFLKDEAGFLKKQLVDIQSRISTLEKTQAQDEK
ncbi:DUF5320 domain-containing protein, partial [Candidatus Omnitrophota bacterium]